MAQAFISRRGGKSKSSSTAMERILTDINYTGRMLSMMKIMDGTLYALLILETSGTLTVNGSYTGDVWLCGGGGGGGASVMINTGAPANGASGGGGGGYTTNKTDVSIVSASVTIGAGGAAAKAGGQTSYATYTAEGGGTAKQYSYSGMFNGGDGGSGGGACDVSTAYTSGKGQGTSTRPFLSQDMPPACAGGGGGNFLVDAGDYGNYNVVSENGGSDGSDATKVKGGLGGEYGGGNGGHQGTSYRGQDGRYYGCGGGGGGGNGSGSNGASVGNGHDGAVMIRIAL